MTNYIAEFSQRLRLEQLDQNDNLFFINKYLGVKPSSFLVAFIIFIIIVMLTSKATTLIVGLTCCLIPAYFTFLSLQSHNSQEHLKYLTYWIIFALVEIVSPVFKFVFPSMIYIILRAGLTIVLLHPSINMTVTIYRHYIEPQIIKYEKSIQTQVQKGKGYVQDQYKKFNRK